MILQPNILSVMAAGNTTTKQLVLSGTSSPVYFPIIQWKLDGTEKWETGLDVLGDHLVLAAETVVGGVTDRIAVCRNGDGEVWIGAPNTVQTHPWPGQLTVTITATDMPGIYCQVPLSYNARLISFAGHEEYFFVDGRTDTSVGMGLTGEHNDKKVYISLTNDKATTGQHSWEIQNQATTNHFVIRDVTGGGDCIEIDDSWNLQINGSVLIGATKLRQNFVVLGDNTYYSSISEVGTDAMALQLTAKGSQYISLQSGQYMSMITGTGAIGFSAVAGYFDFYTSYALAMKITETTQNVLIGSTTDGMTTGGSLAVAKDLAHRGSLLGFYNHAPAAQQTKAGHNNWAALSDVVAALVAIGLFDAA